MTNPTKLDRALELLAVAKTIKGTTFIGLRNYQNKQGEKSNQTIIAGITYENCLVTDFATLQAKKDEIFEAMTKKSFDKAIIEQAYIELYESLEKRLSSDEVKEELRKQGDATLMRSDAQKNAYIWLTKGVKLCKESTELHIFGLVVKKTVLEAVPYKSVNSKPLTICKGAIQKFCEFRQSKYRSFIFDVNEVKLQGLTINPN